MRRRGSIFVTLVKHTISGVMESWTMLDVSDFLTSNSFDEDTAKVFRSNKITGKVLSLLTEKDFKELGLNALSDRWLLSHLLQQFKKVI